MVRFINLEFNYRDALGVTTSEYILLQIIHYRQNAPYSNGWCSDKKTVLAEYLERHEKWVRKMIINLEDLGLIETSNNRMKLRTTKAFYDIVFGYDLGGRKVSTMQDEVDEKCPPKTEQSVHLGASSLYNEKIKKEIRQADPLATLVFPFQSEAFKEAWDHWVADKKEKRKKLTLRAAQMQLKKLSGMTQSDSEAVSIILQSIENNWQTFYPLKTNGKSKSPQAQADSMASRHEEYVKRFGN